MRILKIYMLSGQSCCLVALEFETASDIIAQCCASLDRERTGRERIVFGAVVVESNAQVRDWPGIRRGHPGGGVTEYQLIVDPA
mmetsp:Transcript_50251/g.92848  ORF Transcript_50251/g.92848 Transcript_50251/m.92848 type:complete len:84 (-) Transcript_50251:114-365(-)